MVVREGVELLGLLRKRAADADLDFLREAVAVLAEALMKVEVTALTGVPKGERATGRRLTNRNGYPSGARTPGTRPSRRKG